MNGLTSRSAREQKMHRKKRPRRSKSQSLGLPYWILQCQHHCRIKQVGELSAYMALPVESMQTNVIEWWRRHQTVFPNLTRMARQYLATPATSAGVERLFSAAGLTFGDLAHAMKEETLGCRLLAAYNYTHALYCYP